VGIAYRCLAPLRLLCAANSAPTSTCRDSTLANPPSTAWWWMEWLSSLEHYTTCSNLLANCNTNWYVQTRTLQLCTMMLTVELFHGIYAVVLHYVHYCKRERTTNLISTKYHHTVVPRCKYQGTIKHRLNCLIIPVWRLYGEVLSYSPDVLLQWVTTKIAVW